MKILTKIICDRVTFTNHMAYIKCIMHYPVASNRGLFALGHDQSGKNGVVQTYNIKLDNERM